MIIKGDDLFVNGSDSINHELGLEPDKIYKLCAVELPQYPRYFVDFPLEYRYIKVSMPYFSARKHPVSYKFDGDYRVLSCVKERDLDEYVKKGIMQEVNRGEIVGLNMRPDFPKFYLDDCKRYMYLLSPYSKLVSVGPEGTWVTSADFESVMEEIENGDIWEVSREEAETVGKS